ncbi:MAG: hypothetical protein ACRCU9_00755 [Iodobacter sp.]
MMHRQLLTCAGLLLSSLAMASTVYVQRGRDGSVSYGDAASISPDKASILVIRPATGEKTSAPETAKQENGALEALNKMEQRNMKSLAESRSRLAKLTDQATQEKDQSARSNLQSQIETEKLAFEIYSANLRQIKKNKDIINKEQSI